MERLKVEDDDPSNQRPEKDFSYKLLTTKFEHWSYEEEVRVILRLDSINPESGRYFVPFSSGLRLKEVITGPRSELSFTDVRRLLAEEDQDVKLTQGRLAFRSFKVVRNMAAKDA